MPTERPDESCPGGVCLPTQRPGSARRRRRLMIVLVLTAVFLVIEVGGAIVTGSLALFADAGHMLADIGVLGLASFTMWVAERPASAKKTFGYYRAEILGALASAITLFLLAGFILFEAVNRFYAAPAIEPVPMLGIAALGLLVNVAGAWLLHKDAEQSLNVQGAFLELISDAVSSLAVVAGAAVILTTGFYLIDPILSALIGAFILPRTWQLLNRAINILLEGTPAHISIDEVREALLKVDGVLDVHDLHVWSITAGFEAMSGHIVTNATADHRQMLATLQRLLRQRFAIDHLTVQLEAEPLLERHIAE